MNSFVFRFGIIICLFFASCNSNKKEQTVEGITMQSGTLIFGDLRCGELCSAIVDVTESYNNFPMSHVGMLVARDTVYGVLESIGDGVQITPLPDFLEKLNFQVYIANIKDADSLFIAKAITFGLEQLGKPYNDDFVMDNGKYYCSQLIYDAFKFANNDQPFFNLQPMTYNSKETNTVNPVWEKYFESINKPIPEGLPGCNPGGLSLHPGLELQFVNFSTTVTNATKALSYN